MTGSAPASKTPPLFSGLYTDRYELSMAWVYWREGRADTPAVFDYFFRTLPFHGGYAVFAGAATLVEALEQFRFGEGEREFLRREGFDPEFVEALREFRFRGSIWMPPEGEVVFPLEPVARVEGGLLETQLIETLLLNVLNFQTLIATKAARCVEAARGRIVSEFGLRRAQGLAGRWASRAAAIGGCASTSNLDAARRYGLRSAGTMAHAFVQSHGDELAAFRAYAEVHGSNTVLLLDTYDTLRSGLPNAITVARELAARGQRLAGVRIDSGDLAYQARAVRQALDAAGFPDVKIVASNQLDEFLIRSLLEQGAPIDVFGVGTALAAGLPEAALDGVYKLAECDGRPCLKRADGLAKQTLPGRKAVSRYRDADGRFAADAIHLADEPPPDRMIHPHDPMRRLKLEGWQAEPLLRPVVENGRPVAALPDVSAAAAHARERLAALPAEHHRFENPHVYKVGISPRLAALREELMRPWLET
ncbi:MAG: nicotinate phosphoribosyltransferase [Verrucomicrobia bacterium]|nr:MAG: nicotinate phosphoribosyltransferase [Verrucomicrobiota bacterium]